jgi:hypothetical protein
MVTNVVPDCEPRVLVTCPKYTWLAFRPEYVPVMLNECPFDTDWLVGLRVRFPLSAFGTFHLVRS